MDEGEAVGLSSYNDRREVKLVRFVLNDYAEAHVDHLRESVDRRLTDYWKCQRLPGVEESNSSGCARASYKSPCHILNTDYILDFQFYKGDFSQLDLNRILPKAPRSQRGYRSAASVFCFVDPFGFSIPFCKMQQILGDSNRTGLIVFMVESINRFKGTNSRRLADAVFGEEGQGEGDAGWRKAVDEAGGPEPEKKSSRQHTDWTNRRLEAMASYYCERLRKSLSKKTAKFVMHKGKSSPQKGTLFYECFAGTTKAGQQRTKTAMQKQVQGKPEDGFSDYYDLNNIKVKQGRKTTDEEEGEVIYKHFQGKIATLGEVETFVLEKTPFPYHARALSALKRCGKITNVDYGHDQREGKRCTFGANVHSRLWKIRFASEEEWKKRNEEEEGRKGVPPEKKGKKRAAEKNPGNEARNKKAKVSNKTQKRTAEKKKTQIKKAKTSNTTSAPKNKKKAEEAWIQSGRDFMHKWTKKNSKAIIEPKSE